MKQSEKLDIILRKLYEYRYDGKFYTIDLMLSQEKIECQGEETFILAKRLEKDRFVQRAGNISRSVRLTSHGIDYCESDSYTYTGRSIITNNYNLTISNSPNAILNNQSPNSIIISESSNEILYEIEQINETLNTDTSIDQETKSTIQNSINEISDELKNGQVKKETLKKFLDKSSKISSIGSFVINLLRLISSI